MASYDTIIIGSGPGGYVCAIRCAQLGMKVAVVEGRETLGGTCLNVGCIPSKALLNATHLLHEATHNFARMGMDAPAPTVDWPRMQAYKQETVDANTRGIEFLFKKNRIDWIKGWGSIPAPGRVKVGDAVHEARNIVIATGSEPSGLKGIEIDEKVVVSSTGALGAGADPGASRGDRRRRHRAGDGVDLRAPRRQGHGDRVPRCHHAGHGRRGREGVPEDPREAGA